MTRLCCRRFLGAVFAMVVVLGFMSSARAIDVQRVVSPGGIEAWLIEDHANPILAIRFAFRGGAALDPDGRAGLANMAAKLLDEGAGELESFAFQQRLDDLAIELGFNAGRDAFGGTLRTLTENRDEAARLLSLALTRPRFDAEPVERMRRQILSGLRQADEQPGSVAGRRFFATQFPGHPYGIPSNGTEDSVAAITRDDLAAFISRRIARDGLVVGVVGDISPADLGPLLDTAFAGLPAVAEPLAVADVDPADAGATIVINKAVPQSALIFGHAGMMRDDPDYYAATVVNRVFGGGSFVSRLFQEVREKRGLVYSVRTWLAPFDHAAMVMGRAGTANARVGETIDVIKAEWRRVAENGITAQELADAKLYLTGSFPLRFSSSDRIAGMLVGIQLEDLGIDYLDRRNGLIEAVTLEDANRVARSLFDPDALTFVIVGQPEGVEPTN